MSYHCHVIKTTGVTVVAIIMIKIINILTSNNRVGEYEYEYVIRRSGSSQRYIILNNAEATSAVPSLASRTSVRHYKYCVGLANDDRLIERTMLKDYFEKIEVG